MKKSSRRSFLQKIGLSGLGLSLMGAPALQAEELAPSRKEKGFSFVHLTDMHVKRKRKGHEGYRACIASVNALKKAPNFVLMGGDCAFDGMYTEKEEYLDQLHLFKTISDELHMPWYPCLGNHDTFGLSSRRKTTPDDPDIGKQLFTQKMDMESTYYSFDFQGWHFVVMDSLLQVNTDHGPSQTHAFGKEQLDWLRTDLGKAKGKPTVVVTHIAAFCHIGQINAEPELKAMNHMVVSDTREFRLIIERHNVKLVLQGHSHIPEDFYYNGIWYVTSPSVSAAWWGGNWKGYKPGYTRVNVKGEGLTWERIEFAWNHHLEPEDSLERQRIAEREAFEQEQEKLRKQELGGS
jgi:3',5'-cyclic-AMP phosphodiesterase